MEKLRPQLIPALILGGLLFAAPAFAQLEPAAAYALPALGARTLITNLLRGLLGLLGVFVVSKLIWSLFLLQTHGGNEERIAEAESSFKHAVLGLIVVLSSSALLRFVVGKLFESSGLENFL